MSAEQQEGLWAGSELPDQEQTAVPQPAAPGRPRVLAINRQQMVMQVIDVAKLVPADHEVRAVWELVGRLELNGYYEQIHSYEERAGRTAFDPQLLISLWVYAYSKGISSAREIERLCQHEPAFQWLTGMKVVGYHTLSSFRSQHQELLTQLFVELLGVLSAEGLVSLERVTQDGTKVSACAGQDTFRREGSLRKHLQAAREQVELLSQQGEAEEVSLRVAKARARAAKEKEQRLELALEELEKLRAEKQPAAPREVRVSESDPQARIMKQGNGGFGPSYNVQLNTDVGSQVIVGVGVTQAAVDFDQLVSGVERVAEQAGQPPEQVIVDAGYTTRHNIMEMERRGIDLLGDPSLGSSGKENSLKHAGIAKEFGRAAFSYDELTNTYTCPAGQPLPQVGHLKREGFIEHQYRAAASACQACPSKPQCCPKSKSGRTLSTREENPAIIKFKAKMESTAAQESYKLRGQVAEFSMVWIKAKIGLRKFCLRGLSKVTIEVLWACLTNNVKQWIRLRWRYRSVEATT